MSTRTRRIVCLQYVSDSKEVVARIGDVIKVTRDLSQDAIQGKVISLGDDAFEVDCSKEYRANIQKVFMSQVRSIELIN